MQSHPIVLIDLATSYVQTQDAIDELEELKALVKTYGSTDIVQIIQHRTQPDKDSFIGSGKVVELVQIVKQKKVEIVIINAIVNSRQLYHLTQAMWPSNPDIKVWDRVELILNIFKKHARTAEAKLQIEIAQMHHMGPRVYGLGGTLFSRQGGGIGTRGLRETNVELMKRHWRDQIKKKQEELTRLEKQHQRNLERRREIGLKTVSIVGYTNAGKTSLFNLLTKKDKLVKDALFATLDSITGKLYLPTLNKVILLSDTIGFIQNLPSTLIQAFRSTLMESIYADILIHVVDVSDPKIELKMQVVEHVLTDLGIDNKKQILVFNKEDILDKKNKDTVRIIKEKYNYLPSIFISVKTKKGILDLISLIEKNLTYTTSQKLR